MSYWVAVLSIAAIPSIYGGTDHTDFCTGAGWGVVVIAASPRLVQALIGGVRTLNLDAMGDPAAAGGVTQALRP